MVASLFKCFEKTKELGDPGEANALLREPEISPEEWIEMKEANK